MYLFKGEKKKIIPIKCKLCLQEIKFEVTAEQYSKTSIFPIKMEDIHGDPQHKLIVYINRNLEIDDFRIQNLEEEEIVEIPQEITNKVLRNLGLTNEEIELYYLTSGRDIVSLGEMALLIGKSKERCKQIAEKFIEKGLYKEIIGATPHYTPLPPYAALIGQLKEFYGFISDIKDKMPIIVDKSFSEFETSAEDKAKIKETEEIIKDIKEKMLKQVDIKEGALKPQIKRSIKDIGDFSGITDTVVQSQIEQIKKQFEDINKKAINIIQTQVSGLRDQLNNMKSIIGENLKKLRLGVLQNAIGNSIEKVITNSMKEIQDGLNVQLSVNEMVFTEELNDIIENFDKEFVSKIKGSIENTLSQLEGMDLGVGHDQKAIFENLGDQFNQALKVAEQKINEVYSDIFQSFDSIKDLFSKRVVSKIDDTLSEILDRVNLQEKVTKKFWDQAKKKSTFTMHDVWFIHSPEAARAHINEEISRAKLRILIVAPEITDIDLEAIKSCPSHVNIRVAASIDKSKPLHKEIAQELDKINNAVCRNRKLQNLWGINRDYEEVILCVVSKKEISGREHTEIAGIGSIIEEHIKIFVPILEEAWMGSVKSQTSKLGFSTEIEQRKTKPISMLEPESIEKQKTMPSVKKLETSDLEVKLKKPIVEEQPAKESIISKTEPTPIQQPSDEKKESIPLGELPIFEQLLIGLENIQKNIYDMKRSEISDALNDFYKKYVTHVGLNTMAKNIHKRSMVLDSMDKELTEKEKKDLSDLIEKWKNSF